MADTTDKKGDRFNGNLGGLPGAKAMSKPTQRQKQQRMFELVKQRESLRDIVNHWRRQLSDVEREMRRLVNK